MFSGRRGLLRHLKKRKPYLYRGKRKSTLSKKKKVRAKGRPSRRFENAGVWEKKSVTSLWKKKKKGRAASIQGERRLSAKGGETRLNILWGREEGKSCGSPGKKELANAGRVRKDYYLRAQGKKGHHLLISKKGREKRE